MQKWYYVHKKQIKKQFKLTQKSSSINLNNNTIIVIIDLKVYKTQE